MAIAPLLLNNGHIIYQIKDKRQVVRQPKLNTNYNANISYMLHAICYMLVLVFHLYWTTCLGLIVQCLNVLKDKDLILTQRYLKVLHILIVHQKTK